MAPKSSDPRDVADMLEALARRIRSEGAVPPDQDIPPIMAPFAVEDDGFPALGVVDVFADASAVTVTAETRNTEARHVHVSLLNGRLMIGLGEGPSAARRDVALPAEVDEDTAVATFRNGVLDVVLPIKRG